MLNVTAKRNQNYSCNSVYDFLLTFSRLYHAKTQNRLNNSHQAENRWGKQGCEDTVQRNT